MWLLVLSRLHTTIQEVYGLPLVSLTHRGPVLYPVQALEDLEIGLLDLAPPILLVRLMGTYPILKHPVPQLLVAVRLRVVLPIGIDGLLISDQIRIMVLQLP
jgi:hypothetical protein